MRLLASALAFTLALAPVPALACTPPPGYAVPTNLELADAANAIVLGEVIGGTAGAVLNPQASSIEVRPIAPIKGLMPTGNLVIPGMTLAQPGDPLGAAASDPLAFGDAHPQSYTGACIRRVFPLGAHVLFFLERLDGQWTPAGGAFSRWAEDIASDNAPWVQLATFYVRAARLPPEQRSALLEEQREALLVRTDNPEALAMAADIQRALAGPNPPLVPPRPEPRPEAVPTEPEGAAAEPEPAAEGLADVRAAIDAMNEGAAEEGGP